MNSRSGRSQKIHHNYTKIYVLAAALCIVAAAAIGLTYLHFAQVAAPAPQTETPAPTEATPAPTDKTAQGVTPTGGETGDETPTETPTPQTGAIERLAFSETDFAKPSPLVPVSEDHPFSGALGGMVNCYETKNKSAAVSIPLINSSITMRADAFAAFEQLHFAVNAEYDKLSLFIAAAYTDDPVSTRCTSSPGAKAPCFTDEHASGYAADCWFLTPDKNDASKNVSLQFSDPAAAVYTKFMLDKAAELGIIQSKAKLTGHTQNDLRHLRYVGLPHALYIYQNDLTLEDYLTALQGYNYNKRLKVTQGAASYEVYYVKAETSGDTTVAVPSGSDYTVWSDGIAGYVVTLKTAKTA